MTRSWISISAKHRQISMFALFVLLFGGFHTLFLLSRVPAAVHNTSNDSSHKEEGRGRGWSPSEQQVEITNKGTIAGTRTRTITTTTHAIPRILIFTHYRDLLEQASLTDDEEIVLAANIHRVIDLHQHQHDHPQGSAASASTSTTSTTAVRFLTDAQCIESLERNFPSLVKHFVHETQGMFKADICRGTALYETGGIYLDVDVGVRKDLWLDLRNTTEFVTSRVHIQSHYPKHFFQAILGAAPQSPILYKYLELFEDHYTGKERVEKGPLGVILLRRAWDRVFDTTTGLPESELYQEVLYNKKLFPKLHPAPTWGTRRACHFVVVASVNHPENTELSLRGEAYHIPLFSRIAGSRMCPIDNNSSIKAASKNTQ